MRAPQTRSYPAPGPQGPGGTIPDPDAQDIEALRGCRIDAWHSAALPWQVLGSAPSPGLQAYALLDMTFAPDQWNALDALAPQCWVNLFQQMGSEATVWPFAPAVVALPALDAPTLAACWTGLLALCAGRPMLSVLVCSAPFPELCAHLQRQLWARFEGAGPALLRWADPRALPALLAILRPGQRQRLLQGIDGWYSSTRDGRWSLTVGDATQPFNPAAEPYCISATQAAAMSAAGAADEVTQFLLGSERHRHRQPVPSQLHADATAVLATLPAEAEDRVARAIRQLLRQQAGRAAARAVARDVPSDDPERAA